MSNTINNINHEFVKRIFSPAIISGMEITGATSEDLFIRGVCFEKIAHVAISVYGSEPKVVVETNAGKVGYLSLGDGGFPSFREEKREKVVDAWRTFLDILPEEIVVTADVPEVR